MTDEQQRHMVVRGAAAVPAEQVNDLAQRLINNKGLFADDMTSLQARQLAMLAVAYGLDAWASEITLYEGKPLVTLDGRIRCCADHSDYDGLEYTRPATPAERRAFRVRDHEDMWVACAWRKNVRFPSVGYGRAGGAYERNALVTGSKRTGYNPERGPELARKRAIVNALRLLFPLPRPQLPGIDFDFGFQGAGGGDEGHGAVLDVQAREIGGPAGETLPRITPEQTVAIHAAAKRAGYATAGDAAAYRGRLREMFGVESSTELDSNQAQAAIKTFEAEVAEDAARVPVKAGDRPPGWGGAAIVDEDELFADIDQLMEQNQDEEPRIFTRPARRDVAEEAQALFGGEVRAGPPTAQALDAYATALTRANALGIDLAPYALADASTITADELDALDANLRAAISANEPPERLEGM